MDNRDKSAEEYPRILWIGEHLEPPLHQVHAERLTEDPLALDFLLNEREGEDWVFRRDARIRRPLGEVIIDSGCQMPVIAPDVNLLYKAGDMQPHDRLDFNSALPALSEEQRQWLRDGLETCYPGHEWLEVL